MIPYRIATIIFFFLLLSASCKKYEDYPPEPSIKFLDFTLIRDDQGIDQSGILRFSFSDGDGNIGLDSTELLPPYDYNLFVKYFELQNGDLREVLLISSHYDEESNLVYDTANFNGRIPLLTPAGINKAISGEIEYTLFVNNPLSSFDTIMYEVYIQDRDLNKSNVIQTPLIVIKKQ